MTYEEFIKSIIDTRGQWGIPDEEYYENHHIVPRCLGGGGDNRKRTFYKHSHHPNCIRLYPKEHFIAHRLLAQENPDNYKLVYAWHRISNSKKDLREISPEDYEQLKCLRTKTPFTEEHKKKIGSVNKGKKRPDLSLYNTLTKKGIKDSPETKYKKHLAQTGEKNNHARKVINLDTGEIFGTVKLAAQSVGASVGNLCTYLRDTEKPPMKKYKGYRWKYFTAD